jgi:hypothetical protein
MSSFAKIKNRKIKLRGSKRFEPADIDFTSKCRFNKKKGYQYLLFLIHPIFLAIFPYIHFLIPVMKSIFSYLVSGLVKNTMSI